MVLSRFRSIAFVAALSVGAACSADSPTDPGSRSVTLDQALGELSLPALSAAGASYGGVSAVTPDLTSSRCPYAADVQSFVCTAFVSDGLTVGQRFTLLTATGTPQSAFDAATTAAVRANTTLSGSYTQDGSTFTADGDQELLLSGLLTGNHVLDGSGTVHITIVSTDGTPPISATIHETIAGLAVPANAAPGTWPSAGKISVDSDVDFGTLGTTTSSVTIVFSGSSKVDVTVTSAGATQSCKVDLTSDAPSCL